MKLGALYLAILAGLSVGAKAQGCAEEVRYGPIKDGENLWRIAYNHRPDDRPMQEWTQTIYAANPAAFSSDSHTSLQIGAVLIIPDQPCQTTSVAQKDPLPEPIDRVSTTKPGSLVAEDALQSRSAESATTSASMGSTIQTTTNNTVLPDLPPLPPIPTAAEQSGTRWSVKGELGIEARWFAENNAYQDQSDTGLAVYGQVAAYLPWNNERDGIALTLFGRGDSEDARRSHWDVREFKYFHVGDGWEVHAGIDKVFWGQTESLHLVDVINQTDLVEHPDTEDKLGQPMVRVSSIGDWGLLDVFVMPYFRERTFAGQDGRLRLPVPINTDDDALYESDDHDTHIDYAIRWSHMVGDLEFALSAFDGTSREPMLVADPTNIGQLRPFYTQMRQYGLEGVYLSGDWIWKLEAIRREGEMFDDFHAVVAGFEYTFYGVTDSGMDVGWLMEYQYDSRDQQASVLGQNDVFVGARLAFNDIDSSEILTGWVQDLDDSNSYTYVLEASTRLSAHWTLGVDIWLFNAEQQMDPLYFIRKDDFIQIDFTFHF